jgi:hypothetical protein
MALETAFELTSWFLNFRFEEIEAKSTTDGRSTTDVFLPTGAVRDLISEL